MNNIHFFKISFLKSIDLSCKYFYLFNWYVFLSIELNLDIYIELNQFW